MSGNLPRCVLVLGFGRSGEAVARYLARQREQGSEVTFAVFDEDSGPELAERAEHFRAQTGADVRLGMSEADGEWDVVVASPGIAPHRPLLSSAIALGVPVISELEFAYTRSRSRFVAVTGTNGKTTTTALIAHLLSAAGMPCEAVGNIGRPAISVVEEAGPATLLVAEVSSFQLALTHEFHPRVAVLLNITPDHPDWHGSLEVYEADKAKVFANMGPGDSAVIDVDDPGSAKWADRVEAQGVCVARVSLGAPPAGGAGLVEGEMILDTESGSVPLLERAALQIKGEHNVSNALAGAAAAHALGVPADAIREGLASFEPMEHRLEPAGVVAGVEFYNDSKATNPDAVLKALTAFDERRVILMLGGRNKGNDFGPLADAAGKRGLTCVLFGESLPELRGAFARASVPAVEALGMEDALRLAVQKADAGDVVLLSPACASFDEFRSYEHRGTVFKGLVGAMAEDPPAEAEAVT